MEINGQIGAMAWKVWILLYNNGPQTVAQLRRKVEGTQELLNLSLGWLAREDKVDITQQRKGLYVQLRKALLWPAQRTDRGRRENPRARRATVAEALERNRVGVTGA